MAFVREDYVRNELIPSAEEPWLSGSAVFLDRIESRQNSYLMLRKNLPSAFSTLKSYFDDLESPNLC